MTQRRTSSPRSALGGFPAGPSETPRSARGVALAALARIDGGAYANLVLPGLLDCSGLERRDRAFATDLVYGTTRMRRACDWLIDPHLRRPLEPEVRAALRLGAYQLAFAQVPPHAAVAATVEAAPARARGLVNAVLRRVAEHLPPRWPAALGVRLSYPDWIVERLVADLGPEAAEAALDKMNEPPPVTERADGYVQDAGSQLVAAYTGAGPGELVIDLCAAPGGKATAMATAGARVIALDVRPHRATLVAGNARALGLDAVVPVVGDGRRPPVRTGVADRVVVDAPCSGLGVLRRRPDARWRVEPGDVERLAMLQRGLVEAATALVRPGGLVVYSVCTLTRAETEDLDRWLARSRPDLAAVPPPGPPWEAVGRGARLLPQAAGTDGMYVLGFRAVGRAVPPVR